MRLAIASLVGTVAVVAACSSPADAPPPQSAVPQAAATAAAPVSSPAPQASLLASPGDPRFVEVGLPLLPDNLQYAVRPLDYTKAAFSFAAKHSEVLRYVPCFCGCERM